MNSMTGYGRSARSDGDLDIEVELRSVNHRFLTLKQNLPEALNRRETEIEQRARARLSRGSVSLTVALKAGRKAPPPLPDLERIKACHRRLVQIGKALGLPGNVEMEDLLAIPSLWTDMDRLSAKGDPWLRVRPLLDRALGALSAMRAREGKAIAAELGRRLRSIEALLARIQKRVPLALEAYQKKLDDRIRALLAQKGLELAQADLTKEIAVHADRCDISEEVQRLGVHVTEFRKALATREPVGRRLDFLVQEMGRETNTLASKAGDAAICTAAVEIKAELEKIKEQVENVE